MLPSTLHRVIHYGDALIDHLHQTVDQITTDHPDAGIVIAGDTNRLDIAQLTSGGFTQVVKEPTRQRAVLDKIIMNISGHYPKPRILPPVGHSMEEGTEGARTTRKTAE